MLRYNKNYATLALNCVLKNSKRILLVLEINRRYRNNDIIKPLRGSCESKRVKLGRILKGIYD